jgi:hypothetical protein
VSILSLTVIGTIRLADQDIIRKVTSEHRLPMDYMLKRWSAFTRFLDDSRICLSNNAAERGVRGIALGRKSWLFCGSDRGGERAAVIYSLIITAKMNDVDPQAWLADVLARIAEHPVQSLDELLPWNWLSPIRNVDRLYPHQPTLRLALKPHASSETGH